MKHITSSTQQVIPTTASIPDIDNEVRCAIAIDEIEKTMRQLEQEAERWGWKLQKAQRERDELTHKIECLQSTMQLYQNWKAGLPLIPELTEEPPASAPPQPAAPPPASET